MDIPQHIQNVIMFRLFDIKKGQSVTKLGCVDPFPWLTCSGGAFRQSPERMGELQVSADTIELIS